MSTPRILSDQFRERWFVVMLVAVMYTVLELPFDIAFDLPVLPWMLFDGLVVLVFAADVAINFRLPYKTEEDEWVRDLSMIRVKYLRTWFMYDVISALPVDFIVFAVSEDSSHPLQLLRLLKILRLFRAMKLFNNIDVKGLPGWLQLWFLIYLFILLAHWCACIFWKIAVLEGFDNSWVSLYPGLAISPVSAQYVQSLYWAVSTVTTLGYGDVHPVTFPEYFYVIFAIFVGAACYAIIIAAIGGHFVSSRFAAKAEYNRYVEALRAYEQYQNLPVPLRKDVDHYCDHIWKRRKTFVNDNVVRSLPRSMRESISNAICEKIIRGSHLLCNGTTPGFSAKLVLLLRPIGVSVPGQVLFAADEPITELFLVRRGTVELRALLDVEDMDLVVGRRGEGQLCGDQGLFPASSSAGSPSEVTHEVSGVVDEFGDIYSVSADALLELLASFPREKALFEMVARERKLACEEVCRLYETTPELASNDGKGIMCCGRRRRGRRWYDVWRDVVNEAADDALVDRVLQSVELAAATPSLPRPANSFDFGNDLVSGKAFVVPRLIGGIYKMFDGRPPPQDASAPLELPPWHRKRVPEYRPKVPEFTADVYERLDALEGKMDEVLDLCRKMAVPIVS